MTLLQKELLKHITSGVYLIEWVGTNATYLICRTDKPDYYIFKNEQDGSIMFTDYPVDSLKENTRYVTPNKYYCTPKEFIQKYISDKNIIFLLDRLKC